MSPTNTDTTMDELAKIYKNLQPGELILDVRTETEFDQGHVPGARNIDHEEVLGHIEELKKFSKIYVYCRSGNRVRFVKEELEHAGLSSLACIVSGGMPDWQRKGYEIE